MKKTLALFLILALLCPAALAESVDLSSLSFADLAALRDRCQMEMMKRDEWQEVTVPQGLWEVGAQIPAGTWVIRCADAGRDSFLMRECSLRWGKGKPGDDFNWPWKDEKGDVEIYNPNNENYKGGQITEYVITLEAGDFLYIHPQYNKAVFTPYTGAPSLGFK